MTGLYHKDYGTLSYVVPAFVISAINLFEVISTAVVSMQHNATFLSLFSHLHTVTAMCERRNGLSCLQSVV